MLAIIDLFATFITDLFGTMLRDCLDHVLISGERHLCRVLKSYLSITTRPVRTWGQARTRRSDRAVQRALAHCHRTILFGVYHR